PPTPDRLPAAYLRLPLSVAVAIATPVHVNTAHDQAGQRENPDAREYRQIGARHFRLLLVPRVLRLPFPAPFRQARVEARLPRTPNREALRSRRRPRGCPCR